MLVALQNLLLESDVPTKPNVLLPIHVKSHHAIIMEFALKLIEYVMMEMHVQQILATLQQDNANMLPAVVPAHKQEVQELVTLQQEIAYSFLLLVLQILKKMKRK